MAYNSGDSWWLLNHVTLPHHFLIKLSFSDHFIEFRWACLFLAKVNKKILPSFYIKTNQLTTITGVINGTRRKIQIEKSNIFHTFSRNNSVAQFIWNRRTCKFLAKYVKKWRWSLADETTHVCMFVSGERNFSCDILAGHCPVSDDYFWTCIGVHDW